METEKIILKIFDKIQKEPTNLEYYQDVFALIRDFINEDKETALKYSQALRKKINYAILNYDDNITELVDLSQKTLLFESPYLFDSYLQYLEINRKASEKFYLPRRNKLITVVTAMQELVDDKLDELFISMPPRVGKTSLAMFFATWIIGRNSEASNLYSAFSDVITSAFYNGVIEIIGDDFTYRWKDVFPNSKIVSTNAKDETLNIDRKKRYPSLTCRSLYGTLNGACDCNGILMSDDLIGGIEEALNKDRMVAAWSKVDNNLIPRAKENAKLIWIGTRWSMIDSAGLRMTLLENDEAYKNRRYKIINLPALNENEESNFEYTQGVGFSAEYYKQRRASFERNNDMASWFAQYMGQPIERDGALFSPEDLRYYNGILPEGEPDRIFMSCDPAWGGGDFVSAPVFVQYGDTCYIPSVVFDPGDKYITRPRVMKQILEYKVQAARFEKNNGGDDYKDWIEQELRKQNYRLNITSKMAITTKRKEQRIFDRSPEIRELYFLEAGKRSKDYVLFMQNLFSYKITGKNKNDDGPDSLAMGIEMKLDSSGSYQILKKPC